MAVGVALWSAMEEMQQPLCIPHSASVFEADAVTLRALRLFDKEGVLAAHAKLRQAVIAHEARSKAQGKFCSCMPSHKDSFCKPALESTTGLKNLELADLEVGRWHEGFALRGLLRAKAFRCSNIAVSILEDESGRAARLLAFNTLFWNSSKAEVERMYPEGAEVVVKEPTLVNPEFCQGTALWVPNPMSLEIVSYFPQAHVEDPNVLLGWGAKESSMQNFGGAIDLLTRCIRSLQLDGVEADKKKMLLPALACRAEAWLNMQHYHRALEDANSALALDSKHARSLLIKGLALSRLQQYESSSVCLKQALDEEPSPSVSLHEAYKHSQELRDQSRHGFYDLSDYYSVACAEEAAPDLAEFVGPVQIAMTSDGRGRGLFLTKDVRMGDLLIVSNAVALVLPEKEVPVIMELDKFGTLLTTVLKACMASPRTLAQVYSLAECDPQSGASVTKDEVPNMDLFQPNSRMNEQQELEVDVVRIGSIVACVNESSEATDTLIATDYHGLWTLPAFLNHSCVPNVSVHRVGKALVVVAARDMEAGTELLRSYGSAIAPWNSMRRDEVKVNCLCQRCVLEEQLKEDLEDISDRYDTTFKAPCMLEAEFHESLSQVAVDLEKLLDVLDLSAEQRQWLRTSYCIAYLSYHSSQGKLHELSSGMPSAEVLMDALHSTAPGFSKTLMTMCCFSRQGNGIGRELLEKECTALCGHQMPEVMKAIIEQAMLKGEDFFW